MILKMYIGLGKNFFVEVLDDHAPVKSFRRTAIATNFNLFINPELQEVMRERNRIKGNLTSPESLKTGKISPTKKQSC